MNSRSENSQRQRRVCFIGGARYGRPLDATAAKKFATLAPLGRFWVIGFTESFWPRRFSEQGATFYLLPGRLWPAARYGLWLLAGTVLCAWCVAIHGVRILIAQSPYEAVPAALVKQLVHRLGRRVILIVESHGDFERSLFLQRKVRLAWVYRRVMRWAAGLGAGAADLLRAVSEATGRQLLDWAGRNAPSTVEGPRPLVTFHTWTNLELFFAAGETRRRGATILYAGVLTALKGVEVLLDAFTAIGNGSAELAIAGRAVNPAYAAGLRRRVQEDGLAARVHFLGQLSQVDLARWLAGARAFVLPSFSEGLPRVVLEAMAVGVPVVATAVAGTPEVIEDGVTGWLVPPGDPGALAARLRWILEHREEAESVGRRARELARARFSIAAYRYGYETLFDSADELLSQVPPTHLRDPDERG